MYVCAHTNTKQICIAPLVASESEAHRTGNANSSKTVRATEFKFDMLILILLLTDEVTIMHLNCYFVKIHLALSCLFKFSPGLFPK